MRNKILLSALSLLIFCCSFLSHNLIAGGGNPCYLFTAGSCETNGGFHTVHEYLTCSGGVPFWACGYHLYGWIWKWDNNTSSWVLYPNTTASLLYQFDGSLQCTQSIDKQYTVQEGTLPAGDYAFDLEVYNSNFTQIHVQYCYFTKN